MCNLSDRIEEKGIEKGKMEDVLTLMKKLQLSFEEAICILDIPDYLIDACRKYVVQEMNI